MRLIDAENLKYEKVLSANGNGVYRETNILYESQIDTIKTVEAIPIEFIEEQIAKTTDINNRDELDVLYAGNLGYLLKLWEEENGKSGNSD